MALTIEDGSIVDGADSYATVAQLAAFATKRGQSIPADNGEREVLMSKAMDYLASLEDSYKGRRVRQDQPLSWPRANAAINGWLFPLNEIPSQLIDAQCALAIEAQTVDLLPTGTVGERGPVIRQKVGPIEREFSGPAVNRTVPALRSANAFLGPLLRGSGSGQIPVSRA